MLQRQAKNERVFEPRFARQHENFVLFGARFQIAVINFYLAFAFGFRVALAFDFPNSVAVQRQIRDDKKQFFIARFVVGFSALIVGNEVIRFRKNFVVLIFERKDLFGRTARTVIDDGQITLEVQPKPRPHAIAAFVVQHETETLNEVEEEQGADFLNDENLKCFDCLEIELFGTEEKA